MLILKRVFVAVVAVSFLTVSSFTVFAKDAPGSGPNPFSDCGIGAALFPTVPALAVTSNVIWDVGSTALTSATASPETCSGKNVQAAQFILDTYVNLVEETSVGQGKHLSAVFNILGCEAGKYQEAIHSVRSDMADIVASPGYANQNPVEKASDYYESVSSAVSSYCSA